MNKIYMKKINNYKMGDENFIAVMCSHNKSEIDDSIDKLFKDEQMADNYINQCKKTYGKYCIVLDK